MRIDSVEPLTDGVPVHCATLGIFPPLNTYTFPETARVRNGAT
jgi:hypothetical protein